MIRREEISQLKYAIELTETAAKQAGTISLMEMHKRAIARYKKRLESLEDKCYTCNKPCEVKCVRSSK